MYTYAWYHWLTFFYIYCFCGWVFESTYVSLKQHHFVNRGFLRLPMLPLYGTGAVMLLSAGVSPAVGGLFRGLEKGGRAAQLICMNLSANILGLGNATTPLGIRAMEAIQEEAGGPGVSDGSASDNMIMLTVLNTASLQLIPATAAALMTAHGAARPMEILPCV